MKEHQVLSPTKAKVLPILCFLSLIPLAFMINALRWALLASYLVAPNGWIVWVCTVLMVCGTVYSVRVTVRRIRLQIHLRKMAAPKMPWNGTSVIAFIFCFNGLLAGGMALAVRAYAPMATNKQWIEIVNRARDEMFPYMPRVE